jgi:transcriptional regulator with XRE-family HTH domain
MMANRKLIAAREHRFWTQEELAERLGVTPITVSRWENDVQRPRPYMMRKLCDVFGLSAEALGFLDVASLETSSSIRQQEQADVHTEDRYPLFCERNTPASISQTSNIELLKSIIERKFSKEITYDLLSSNIKTMNFRDEWQYVVNNLVSETRMGLRAMVFDVELTRWWNTIAGQIYMMTNMDLLKRKVPVKRIFILSSLDARLRRNTLITAYVHHKIGIDVKICKVASFQDSIPFKPDMFSVHDDLFVTLYYFSLEKPIANLLLEDKYISEFISFYDELFIDDRLCIDIESVLAHSNCSESFFASIKMQLEMLRSLEKIGSVTELARKLEG